MARSYINNVDDLQAWFELIDCAKWNLYRGHHERLPQTSLIFKQEDDAMTVAESFTLMRRLMEQSSHGGGYFTVYVPGRSANKGYTQKIVLNTNANASVAGMPALAGHPAAMGYIPAEEVDRRITEALEKQEMQRRIEDLEGAREGNMSIGESMANRFMESFDFNLLAPAINAFVTGIMPQKQAFQLQGTVPDPSQPAPQAGEDVVPEEEHPAYQFDAARILPLMEQIRHQFDDYETFYAFLDTLTAKFLQSPEMFKTMIKPPVQ